MPTWSEGYLTEIDYIYDYQPQLHPSRFIIPFLMAGIAPPQIKKACELGFGHGLSLNVHAAASNIEWWGTDFNPNHVLSARHLSEQSGANPHIYHQSFAEFLANPEVPNFDFIALHGIWSWVNRENQDIIVDFIRKKLNVGGVVYISYNVLPGWNAKAPIRQLITQYSKILGTTNQPREEHLNEALGFVRNLLPLTPEFTAQTPGSEAFLNSLNSKDPHYLVHEYLNDIWQPSYFYEIHEQLCEAKLNYACSGNYLDDYLTLLSPEQQAVLDQIHNLPFAQTVKDFMRCTQFRRDYWIKGGRKLSPTEQAEIWNGLSVLLIHHPQKIERTVRGSVTFNEEVLSPLLELLSDYRVHNIGTIVKLLGEKIKAPTLYHCLALLHAKDIIAPATDKPNPSIAKLNAYLLHKSREENSLNYLISPITGSAYRVERIIRLFILAYKQGETDAASISTFTWEALKRTQNHLIDENGEIISSDEGNLKKLLGIAKQFLQEDMEIFKALGII